VPGRYTRLVSFDVDDFYSVVNALRDACGCPDCLRIALLMLDQSRAQVRAAWGSSTPAS
jgi:hypothetical protein